MDTMRRSLLLSPLVLSAAMSGAAGAQTPPPEVEGTTRLSHWPEPSSMIDLWPMGVSGQLNPNLKEVVIDDSKDGKTHFRHLSGVSKPRLAVFPAKKPNGGAMLIIPGGGFVNNYFDHEGYMLADYLNSQGITCFVLFYRLAQDGWDRPPFVGPADTLRAMRLIKQNAAQYKLDSTRVGVIGFSAGGFLTGTLATRHAATFYEPVDAADALDARPMLAAPIYAVQSMDPAIGYSGSAKTLFGGNITPDIIQTWSPDHNVDATTPPIFMVQAEDDDAVPIANTLSFRDACKAQKITVETHLFAKGGHGFGMKPDLNMPYHIWPQLFVNFARSQGLMGTVV